MAARVIQPVETGWDSASLEEVDRLEKEQSQEARVRAILADGIPTLPAYVFELSALLSAVPVDLGRVCRVIRTDPSLTAQVIRLCNSVMSGTREKVSNIEYAVVLLGTERLKTLTLTCSLVECVGNSSSPTELPSFWQHSLLAATLSERMARFLNYSQPERAYLAGLLHDVGVLPLLILALRSKETKLTPGSIIWGESLELEQKQFGVDHCSVGKCIGISWNFSPEIIEVLEHHHRPREARQDPVLVEIVAAADLVCQMHGVRLGAEPSRIELGGQNKYKDLLDRCAPSLSGEQKSLLAKTLEAEFPDIIGPLRLRLSGVSGDGMFPWPSMWR